MTEVGWATLGVIPSFQGFERNLAKGTAGPLASVGRSGGAQFGDAAGQSAGRSFTRRFSNTLRLGGGFAAIGAAFGVGSFIKDSVQLEAAFSKTMAQIRVATEAPAKQLKDLDDLAIRLGKDTIFSASDASGAMLELAKNGIKPATIEAGALKSALTLAAAGDTDLTVAATTMGNALNAFSLKGEKSRKVASALAGAANASSASVQSLAEGLQQSAATAADVGFNIEETTGILAAFANAGVAGSDAGTSLKTMLSRLLPSTNKARKAMEKYGLDFVKANGEFESAVTIAEELREGLGKLSGSERSAALNTVFGSDARRAATILVKEGADGIRDYIKATSDQQAADRMAKANMEGTSGAIERLAGAWETAKLEFGKALAPAAVKVLDAISSGVDDLGPRLANGTEWFIDKGIPAMQNFADDAKEAWRQAERLADFLADLPTSLKISGLAGIFAGANSLKKLTTGTNLFGKMRGASAATPMYVWTVNGGGGVTGPAGKLGKAGSALSRSVLPVSVVAWGAIALKDFYNFHRPDDGKGGRAPLSMLGKGEANKAWDRLFYDNGPISGGHDAFDKVRTRAADVVTEGEKAQATWSNFFNNVGKNHKVNVDRGPLLQALTVADTFSRRLDGINGRVVEYTIQAREAKQTGQLTAPNRGGGIDSGEALGRSMINDNRIFIQSMNGTDTKDIERQAARRRRARSGGGRS